MSGGPGGEFASSAERMWSEASLLGRLVAVSVRSAERAGREIKSICAAGSVGLDIVDKGKNDLQTAADRTAQWTLLNSIRARFGEGLAIVAEEDLEPSDPLKAAAPVEDSFAQDVLHADRLLSAALRAAAPKDIVVWIDPLDGTNEFAEAVKTQNAQALEQATVLVGVAVEGRPVAGVIHQPFFGSSAEPAQRTGRTLWAIKGAGLHGAEVRPADLSNRLIVTTRSHGSGAVEKALESLRAAGLLHDVLRCGGAGYKVLRMLDGGATAYIFASPGTKKWDTCGPEAILNEVHGTLTDVHGTPLPYDIKAQVLNSAGVVATRGVVHDEYIKALPDDLKASLQPLIRSQSAA